MSRKASTPAVSDTVLDGDRASILRAVYDKSEREPPLGERYEFLLKDMIRSAITDSGLKLSKDYTDTLVDELFAYVASLGPIEPYLSDPQISEVMVNGPDQIFIEKNGEMLLTDTNYESI